MAIIKKAATLLTALIIAGSAVGCADTSYTIKADSEEVRAGIYINYMLSEMSYQIQMLYYMQGVTENYFDQKIDDKTFSQYISESALKNTKEHVAINKKFDELGLELTNDEIEEINSSVASDWEGQSELFEIEGISKESIKDVYTAIKKREKIFNSFYEEGGTDAVSDEDLQKYVDDNYLRYKQISISKASTDDDDADKTANEENKALRDEYLKKAKDLSFEEFDSVIDEYAAYQESLKADDSASSSDSDSSADSNSDVDSSDDSNADSDTDSTDDTSSTADSDVDSSDDSDSSADDSNDSSDASDDSSSADEENDPYKNETMANFASYKDADEESSYAKMLSEIDGLEQGVATAYENDTAYYILIKGDVTERTDYKEDNRTNLLQQMKSEEFQSKLDDWVSKINFVSNEKAIKRYTPEVVYDKQNKYYKSING